MTQTYALGTFARDDEAPFAALVIDDNVYPLDRLPAPHSGPRLPAGASVLDLLQDWDRWLPILDRLADLVGQSQSEEAPLSMASLRVLPPVNLPRQVFCTGANYRQHVIDLTLDMGVGPEGLDRAGLRAWAEKMMDERAEHGEPYVFVKPISAIAGAYDPIVAPVTTAQFDWELELGVVIGKGGYQISRADAFSHVAGYAITNDLTARDLIARQDYKMLGTDWLRAKGQRGFLPFGPLLVPAQFVADPHALNLKLSVAGKTMQNESSADMIFNIARQIEYISTYTQLLPGDLICTGSPAGNGTHYGRFLQPGDEMVGEIEGLGVQRATCVSANS